jgi:hypothetical protein
MDTLRLWSGESGNVARVSMVICRSVMELKGFLLLLGLKEHIWPDAPTTFLWRFARAWCKAGLTEWRVREAIKWLMSEHYMSPVGQHQGQFEGPLLKTIQLLESIPL